jgi:hypothetical protein
MVYILHIHDYMIMDRTFKQSHNINNTKKHLTSKLIERSNQEEKTQKLKR